VLRTSLVAYLIEHTCNTGIIIKYIIHRVIKRNIIWIGLISFPIKEVVMMNVIKRNVKKSMIIIALK